MKSELLGNVGKIIDHSPDSVVTSAAKQVIEYIISGKYGYQREYLRLVTLYLNHMDRGGNYDEDTLLARMSEDWIEFKDDTIVVDDEPYWLPEDKVNNGPTLFDGFDFRCTT